MGSAKQRNDLIDQSDVVLGKDAEGVADDVVEATARQVEIDMVSFLLRPLLVQQASRREDCFDRIVARTAGLADGGGYRDRRYRSRRCRWRRGLFEFLMQRLEHPRGF